MPLPEILSCAYPRWQVIQNNQPTCLIPACDVPGIAQLYKARTKSYASSVRATSRADLIGGLGELVLSRIIGLSGEQVWQDFLDGLSGDGGIDAVVRGYSVDVKATQSRWGSFTFTVSNRNAHQAELITFIHLRELPDGSIAGTVLGCAWSRDVHRYLKPSKKNPERLAQVSIRELTRAGKLFNLALLRSLKAQTKGGIA